MVRNEMSEVRLSDASAARGPKPSFKPAVEALEERIVLDASTTSAPMTCPTDITNPKYVKIVNGSINVYNQYIHGQISASQAHKQIKLIRNALLETAKTGQRNGVRKALKFIQGLKQNLDGFKFLDMLNGTR